MFVTIRSPQVINQDSAMPSSKFTPNLLNRLRMRQVSLLLSISDTGTLRAASESIGLTQPAATKMLHELESAIGHPLFDRVGRGLKLTPTGESVLATFRGMRGSVEALGRNLAELHQGSAGRLFIGSIMAASPSLLTNALIEIKNRFPLLSVDVTVGTSDQLRQMLQEGALDLVIGRLLDLSTNDYLFRPLDDEKLAVVAAPNHPLSKNTKGITAFSALLSYPWILQPPGSPMRLVIEQEFKAHHAAIPRGLIETSSILTTMNLIAKSNMIAVIPLSVATPYAKHGLLSILKYNIKHKLSAYGSIVRKDRPLSAAALQFLSLIHS